MTEVIFQGKKVVLSLDMYSLRMFGNSVSAETPGQAMGKLQDVYKAGKNKDVTFEMFDIVAGLFYSLAKSGMRKAKLPFDFDLEDCYDVLKEEQAVSGMLIEISNFYPEPETVKKKQVAKTESVA